MKCPKCHYLGFDTGDRCRNCGYDFSLLAAPAAAPVSASPLSFETGEGLKASDLSGGLKASDYRTYQNMPSADGFDRLADLDLHGTGSEGAQLAVAGAGALSSASDNVTTSRRRDPLPLFIEAFDDQPLVRLPAAPRPPLSVRRTPDAPRVKSLVTSRRRAGDDDAQLALVDEPSSGERSRGRARSATGGAPTTSVPCTAGARLGAAMLDLGMLSVVDLFVLYFTLRMAALSWAEWQVLPLVPFVAFLLIIKVAYYWAFTAIGGQTIGKMAMRIRVIADDGIDIDPATALRRTVLAATSVITLGLAFLPALVRGDRRAVHDHIAHTRVIALPAA